MKTKYVYRRVMLLDNDLSDLIEEVVVRFELFEDATFVLHIFTQQCEELTSFRTTLPLEV